MEYSTRYPGQLDPDFIQLPEAPGWVDLLRALNWSPIMDLFFASAAPAPDGMLYVCGYFAQDTNAPGEYFITRLRNDASLDTSFGEQGIVRGTFPADIKIITPTRLKLQDDGKLLMQSLGYSNPEAGPAPVTYVLRLLNNGQPDSTFADRRPRPHAPGLADRSLQLPAGRARRPARLT